MGDVITAALGTITSLVTSVFELMTSNTLCVVFLGASLLGVGFMIFRRIKSAAKN